MRIMYVALTRAKEKLIILGSGKKINDKIAKSTTTTLIGKISEYACLNSNSFFDWLLLYVANNNANYKIIEKVESALSEEKNDRDEQINQNDSHEEANVIANNEISYAYRENNENIENENEKEKGNISTYELLKTEVDRRLDFSYPEIGETIRPLKISVTALKKKKNDSSVLEFENYKDSLEIDKSINPILKFEQRPTFLSSERRLNSAEKGTLMHFVMQMLDFNSDPENVITFINSLVSREMIKESDLKEINIDWIQNFLRSDVCKRIRNSQTVLREAPFKIMIPAKEAGYPDSPKNAETLLQGIIDCMFFEKGKWILLDYKTDYYEKGAVEKIANSYRVQLEWYKRAVEKVTKERVDSKCLYFFRHSDEIWV